MVIPPQKFREIVFQILYSYDLSGDENDCIVPFLMRELSLSKKTVQQAIERADQMHALLGEIDPLITSVSHSYTFNRIQRVEKNILRLGVYELLFEKTIPPKVVIAEAIRICRKFTSHEAGAFVNAILDILYKKSLGKEARMAELQAAVDALTESEHLAHEVSQTEKPTSDEP